jgi:hypothetical protein
MTLTELQKLVDYVTDADDEPTAVMESGFYPIDEDEPKAQISADLTEAVRSTKARETFPVSELWDHVYP